jgi:hypothetical protein
MSQLVINKMNEYAGEEIVTWQTMKMKTVIVRWTKTKW